MRNSCLFVLSLAVFSPAWIASQPPPAADKGPEGPEPPSNFLAPPAYRIEAAPGDQKAAIVLVRMQGGQCTGSIIDPPREDGREWVLCAAHCLKLKERANLRLADGRVISATTVARDAQSDLCWLLTDRGSINPPARAKLARTNPTKGTKIWHAGYGVHVPGNVEQGHVLAGQNQSGQIQYWLSVSPGDSGGPFFRSDNGEVVGAACCTTRLSGPGYVWAGSPLKAWALKPGGKPVEVKASLETVKGDGPMRPRVAIHPTLHVCDCDDD